MSSGTQYMLQKNPRTRLLMLTFGTLIIIIAILIIRVNRNIVKDGDVKKLREKTGWHILLQYILSSPPLCSLKLPLSTHARCLKIPGTTTLH